MKLKTAEIPSAHSLRRQLPLWQQLLIQRGLSQATIRHFQLSPRNEGWMYPVHPRFEEARWKAFDSHATPKYLWLPNKPEGMQFYDVDGRLHRRIADANGVLWLASGEADVWALWEGELDSATCLFDGETRRIPEWFLPKLERLSVSEVHLAPDCDEPGHLFAGHIYQALTGTSIRLVVHRLPFDEGSSGDIGQLLLAVGASALKAVLHTLPELEIIVSERIERHDPVYWQLPLPQILPDYRLLFDLWCVEIVEATALRYWNISPPNGKGFSKSFRCPFHDDHHPSASWNYNTHSVHCFACGTHRAKEVADFLGVRSWQDFKLEFAAV